MIISLQNMFSIPQGLAEPQLPIDARARRPALETISFDTQTTQQEFNISRVAKGEAIIEKSSYEEFMTTFKFSSTCMTFVCIC